MMITEPGWVADKLMLLALDAADAPEATPLHCRPTRWLTIV